MSFDRDLFKELDTSVTSKVKMGNGYYVVVKRKGTSAIESISDANGDDVFKVNMTEKSFAFDPLEEEQVSFYATKLHAEI
ncbi:hypothetical protein HRI_001384200 [Hibiscus trionum]|uniref:Uncharacterized protein n=1 Tax=Hibiscus trionum TaxID=183268 RepID=A0A9W7LTY5_HIBTR|nr:hypothetical protein HRI_001384200 [Hibiscus trionum]